MLSQKRKKHLTFIDAKKNPKPCQKNQDMYLGIHSILKGSIWSFNPSYLH